MTTLYMWLWWNCYLNRIIILYYRTTKTSENRFVKDKIKIRRQSRPNEILYYQDILSKEKRNQEPNTTGEIWETHCISYHTLIHHDKTTTKFILLVTLPRKTLALVSMTFWVHNLTLCYVNKNKKNYSRFKIIQVGFDIIIRPI